MGFLVKCVAKDSSLHGKGLFADQDIKRGTVIYDENEANYDILSNDDYIKMSEKEKEGVRFYCSYDSERDIWEVPLDDAKYTNHSNNPNVSFSKETNLLTALKDIKKGEEILVDYREIDDLCKENEFDFDVNEKLKYIKSFNNFNYQKRKHT